MSPEHNRNVEDLDVTPLHLSQVRAPLDQKDLPENATREQALTRIYYNMLLLQKWHGGSIPKKSAINVLKAQASRLAKAAKPPS
jgi:hypothetical protein